MTEITDIISFTHESASADLILWGDGSASLIDVYSTDRGKGHVTKVLGKVKSYADENRINLILIAESHGDEPRPTTLQLKALYEKFDFVAVDEDATAFIQMKRNCQ